jgi:5-methylcytosine-specific restriction enzyme subunit McrC
VRRLTLTEFRTERAVALSVVQRDSLRRLHPGMRCEPSIGVEGTYDLTPDQHIGLVCLPELVIEVQPKVPMSSVMFLVSYACDSATWFDRQVEFAPEQTLVEIVAIIFSRLVEHTTRRGLLNGYQLEHNSLPAPRGRIRFDDQIRRHLGLSPPVEVSHDVFTADILENRILLAAVNSLGNLPLLSPIARRELLRARRLFGAVQHEHFAPARVPDIVITRLNQHYQASISLATMILRSTSLDLGTGGARGSAFLIDMNLVFEHFVRIALRSALAADLRSFPNRITNLRLDEANVVPLKPDLCLLVDQRVAWVGDAKYKRLPAGAYSNADLYQLLAYSVAMDLPGGTLIYAADAGVNAAKHVVKMSGKQLTVVAMDLSAPPAVILRQIRALAAQIAIQADAVASPRLGKPIGASLG